MDSIANAIFVSAKDLAVRQIERALERAKSYKERRVPHQFGGKNESALDCSGLMHICYPMLPQGAADQYAVLRGWVFDNEQVACAEEGDLIFFAHLKEPNIVSVLFDGAVLVVHRCAIT